MATDTEKLFDKLLEFTDFNSTDEINTEEDLEKYFDDLKDKAGTERQKNQFKEGGKTRQLLLDGWKRIKEGGKTYENERRKKGVESSRVYTGSGAYEKAKQEKRTFYAGNKEVYKSVIIVYRDKNGKIIKDKKLKADIEAKRYKQPNKFKVVKK